MVPPNRPTVCDQINRATTPCLLPTTRTNRSAPRASGCHARKRRGKVVQQEEIASLREIIEKMRAAAQAELSLATKRNGIFDLPICHHRSSRHCDYSFAFAIPSLSEPRGRDEVFRLDPYRPPIRRSAMS